MRICDLASSVARIQHATKELHDAWLDTKPYWHDKTSRDFEKNFLDPILPELRLLMAEVREVEEMYAKVKTDCSEHSQD
ncbi:MAG: hypothetical protein KDA87_01100 [Planctomycetales bacterium]|nr:hypothetical protein [Planctomycetales bacterium]